MNPIILPPGISKYLRGPLLGIAFISNQLIRQKEGARGVMVIVVGNGLGDTSSNPGRG